MPVSRGSEFKKRELSVLMRTNGLDPYHMRTATVVRIALIAGPC